MKHPVFVMIELKILLLLIIILLVLYRVLRKAASLWLRWRDSYGFVQDVQMHNL